MALSEGDAIKREWIEKGPPWARKRAPHRAREKVTVNGTTRAKSGRLLVKKRDKAGREYIGQNETVVSSGMFSSSEMERELQRAADESTEEVVDATIDHYAAGDAPIQSAPSRVETDGTTFTGFRGSATWPPESDRTANTRR